MKAVDQSINFCKYLSKRNAGNFIANFVTSFLKKNEGPFSTCPVKKVSYYLRIRYQNSKDFVKSLRRNFLNIFSQGLYSLRNLTLNTENLDMPVLQQAMGPYKNVIVVLESGYMIKEQKKMITIFNVTYTGRIKVIN